MCSLKAARGVANSVDPDQAAPQEQSDQGLNYFLSHACPDIEGRYSIDCQEDFKDDKWKDVR